MRPGSAAACNPRPYPPFMLWPLIGLWKLITLVANLIGIVLSLLIGAVLMFVGFALTTTIIGAVLGVPLFLIGMLLFIRGLW
jgi:hypothetical protein